MPAHLHWMGLRGLSQGSIEARRRVLLQVRSCIGKPLAKATVEDLEKWREGLRVTPRTINDYVSHARCFYNWAVMEGLCRSNPAARLPVPRGGRRVPRPIGEADLVLALATAPARIRPWLVLAAWCGLRAKEIALLERENVLESANPPVLLVDEHATKGQSERIVPLTGFVIGELQRAGLPAAGYLFGRLDGRPGPNQPWNVSHLANQHLHDCGVSATLHQLRHRFGTQAYRASRDLRVVQELLGHKNPSTTALYTAWDRASAAAAVAAVPLPPDAA
jgi:integrase